MQADDGLRDEVVAALFEMVALVLSVLCLVAAGQELLRRGHNLTFWGA
jgi:hypothetical protein